MATPEYSYKNFNKLINFLILFLVITTQCSGDRENLAYRNPCYSRNERLTPFVTFTERLINSQYKTVYTNDACGYRQPSCCTKDIINSYSTSITNELKILARKKFTRLTNLLSNARNQIALWVIEHLGEIQRLTEQSMETLFGTYEYRHNIHYSIGQLFDSLKAERSDEVHKPITELFKHMIVSTYRHFMMNDNNNEYNHRFTDEFRSCLITKGFEIDVFPSQREILYILSSSSTILNILRNMLTYIESDMYRLKNDNLTIFNENLNDCTQKYSRATLCPICSSNSIQSPICYSDCRQFIRQCISNSSQNPYGSYAMKAKGYAIILQEMQSSIIELNLLERLSKLHIYLYDMVANAINNAQTYKQLQSECPNGNSRQFAPINSLPPVMNERQELVNKWNTSIHRIVNDLSSNLENLNITLESAQLDICKNIRYATKSNDCSKINDDGGWPSQVKHQAATILSIENNIIDYTENQLKELNKKMELVSSIVISLRPKKMPSIIDIPNFEFYDDSSNNVIEREEYDVPSPQFENSYNNFELDLPMNESFSNQIYKRIEEGVSNNSVKSQTAIHHYRRNNHTERYFYPPMSSTPAKNNRASSGKKSIDHPSTLYFILLLLVSLTAIHLSCLL